MAKNFSYATQTTTPCNINRNRWAMVNAMQKAVSCKNPERKGYYTWLANYYLNGHVNVLFKNKK